MIGVDLEDFITISMAQAGGGWGRPLRPTHILPPTESPDTSSVAEVWPCTQESGVATVTPYSTLLPRPANDPSQHGILLNIYKETGALPEERHADRLQLGCARVVRVLRTHHACSLRTLEQKISDAGPSPQRIDPHILTEAIKSLKDERRIVEIRPGDQLGRWFHLPETPAQTVQTKLDQVLPLLRNLIADRVTKRTGQALEIAVYRAILGSNCAVDVFGGYGDLDAHDDSTLYTKQEIQRLNGNDLGREALDFIVRTDGHLCGIEVKNVRPWMYPHDEDIRQLLRKCLILKVHPVFIARRIHFSTVSVFKKCGLIIHQTYNQRMALSDTALADQVKHKDALGYHDIRCGNLPDARLTKFIAENLSVITEDAIGRFERYKDLISNYAFGAVDYEEFAGRARRRERDEPEDGEFIIEEAPEDW